MTTLDLAVSQFLSRIFSSLETLDKESARIKKLKWEIEMQSKSRVIVSMIVSPLQKAFLKN